jgi:hypothetical protein
MNLKTLGDTGVTVMQCHKISQKKRSKYGKKAVKKLSKNSLKNCPKLTKKVVKKL